MAVKNRIVAFPRLERASSSMIFATLQEIDKDFNGATVTEYEGPVTILRIVNDSDKQVAISFDGVNKNDHLAANTSVTFNAQSNAMPTGGVAVFPKNIRIWASGDPGLGNVYVCAYGQVYQ